MLKTFICRSARLNKEIMKIHLTRDADPRVLPSDLFMNIPVEQLGEEFAEGDEWLVQMTKVRSGSQSQ